LFSGAPPSPEARSVLCGGGLSVYSENRGGQEGQAGEYDWQRRDRYGRLLAFVNLPDGTFLNAELIRQGYGHAYTKYPFKYMDEFKQLEREARESGKGLWK
jgi:endonuclease YncB( thermonuclease family)